MNVDPDKQDNNANTLAGNRPPQDIAEENQIEVKDHFETERNKNLASPSLISSTVVNSSASNEKQSLESTELTGSKKDGKVTDDWEVVDASSDESEVFTEYSIKIPLKLLEKAPLGTEDKLTVNIPPSVSTQKAVLSKGQANSNDDDCIVIGSNSENISTKKSTESTQSNSSINEKQNINTKTAKPNAIKKRKFRLFTGESDDEIIPQEIGHKKHLEKQISTRENVQVVQHEPNQPTATNTETNMKQRPNNQSSSSNLNETYTKSKSKSYSDTEVTDNNMPLGRNTRQPNLPNVTEESDDEIVVPRSPQFDKKSNNHDFQSRNKLVNLDKSPHKHCKCSSAPLVGSSNSKQVKRQKFIQHMLQERKRKLKMKMVKRVKDVFFQVLESLMSSSDESDALSASDDETGFDKMLKRKRPNKRRHEPYQQQSNDPENMRDLEREIQYWKSKAQSKPEVLSPQELQMKEMREKLNYWKKIAMAKSRANDVQSLSCSMGKINLPIIEHEEPLNRRQTSVPNGTRGTSTPDTAGHSSHFPIPDLNQSEHRPSTEEYPNEVEDVDSSHMRPNQTNLCTDKQFKAANSSHASHALSVMSRTKFTEKEKDAMIEYLVKHYDSLELIKGNMFWMQMAHDLNTYRSWHSLKNNFFQSIMKNLEQYEIPLKVRNKIISIARQYM
uniref:Uncharacterized protein n=1 Tax=Cacopsylla melanoneura TaxID=428564 RepID=A0A8D8YM91_9HEMI